MRYFILPLAIILIFSSCNSSKKTVGTAGNANTSTSTSKTSGEADGSSFENAIVIDEKTEGKGIDAEYAWLKKNYPGYHLKSQSLTHKGKQSYDILSIKTADGKTKDIYFDITKFFGRL